jgi:glycosyltransferase involved in cell wall biosynthesis
MPILVDVIIPALNEEKSVGHVLRDLPKDMIRNIVVSDNGSKDQTAKVAQESGAKVVFQPLPGYGNACLKALEWISTQSPPDILVFLDGDYSDYPEEIKDLIQPIIKDDIDLVIGSRVLGKREKGSLTVPQVFGNWLATRLIKILYGYSFTDLGPFRAVKYDKFLEANMVDKNYGWTVELQVKAAKLGWKCTEIPVKYRKRIGVSKVSGTIKGVVFAGYKILYTIFILK